MQPLLLQARHRRRHRRASTGFSPANVGGLHLWLDAADGLYDSATGGSPVAADGAAVGRWQDRSGNGWHATQATPANRPTLRTGVANALPVVRFDGIGHLLALANPFLAGALEGEVFRVARVVADPAAAAPSSGMGKFGSSANACHYPYLDGVI